MRSYEIYDEKYSSYITDIISNPLEVIDTKITGMVYYQNFILNSQFDNLNSKIILLCPNEYYETTSMYGLLRGKKYSVQRLKDSRHMHSHILNNIKAVIKVESRKLCLPILDFYHKKQEGLHRMMAIGNLYTWNFKVPVLIVYSKDQKIEFN